MRAGADRVATAQRYHICGACKYCRTGRETLCPDRKFLGDWGLVGGSSKGGALNALVSTSFDPAWPSVPAGPAACGWSVIRATVPWALP